MTVKSHHSRLFEELVAEHREALVDRITSGVSDYADYRALCGQLYGLAIAVNISHQADLKLSGEL